MLIFVVTFVLICAGINIAVQGSLFTVANEVVHPNFQVSTSLEVLYEVKERERSLLLLLPWVQW